MYRGMCPSVLPHKCQGCGSLAPVWVHQCESAHLCEPCSVNVEDGLPPVGPCGIRGVCPRVASRRSGVTCRGCLCKVQGACADPRSPWSSYTCSCGWPQFLRLWQEAKVAVWEMGTKCSERWSYYCQEIGGSGEARC